MFGDLDSWPECGSEDVFRSRTRSRKERIFRSIFPVHYYRCTACHWRRPVVNAQSRRDWGMRWMLKVLQILLAIALLGSFFFLAQEGARRVTEKPPATRKK
jgi:hypothetical protein